MRTKARVQMNDIPANRPVADNWRLGLPGLLPATGVRAADLPHRVAGASLTVTPGRLNNLQARPEILRRVISGLDRL